MSAEEEIQKYIESLSDKDFEVRKNAIWELGEMGKAAKKAVKTLIKSLNEREDELCYLTIYALEKIGKEAKEVFPELIGALKHENLKISLGVERILGKIGRDAKQVKYVALAVIQVLKDQCNVENSINDMRMCNSCIMILEKLYVKIDDLHLRKTIKEMLIIFD